MRNNVVCIASFKAKEGAEENLKQALGMLVEPTRIEKGCVSYDLLYGIEDARLFTVVEVFESREAFLLHGEQPYLLEFKEKLGDLVESVSVNLHKVVE